jgi:hypothetical protein
MSQRPVDGIMAAGKYKRRCGHCRYPVVLTVKMEKRVRHDAIITGVVGAK